MYTNNQKDLGLTDASCTCESHSHAHTANDNASANLGKTTSTYGVLGMTCSHCVASVTDEVSQLDGAQNVEIQLVPGGVSLVTISSTRALDREAVAAAIDEAGCALTAESR